MTRLPAFEGLEAARTDLEQATALRVEADSLCETAREAIRDALYTLAVQVSLDEELRVQTLRDLYWSAPELPPTWIADAFGLKAHELVALAGPVSGETITFRCPQCQLDITYSITVKSRTELKERRKWASTGQLCDECRDQRDDEYRARAALRQARLQELRSMPYRLYLQTEEWKARREEHLKRARYRCQVCNASGSLQVHHRTYSRRGEEHFKDLLVLCGSCHHLFHENNKLATE